MAELDEDLEEMEELRQELADYFCEDVSTFKLEDAIKIFHTFCEKFKKALEENKQRKIQEEKAEQRRRQREEQTVKRRSNTGEKDVLLLCQNISSIVFIAGILANTEEMAKSRGAICVFSSCKINRKSIHFLSHFSGTVLIFVWN